MSTKQLRDCISILGDTAQEFGLRVGGMRHCGKHVKADLEDPRTGSTRHVVFATSPSDHRWRLNLRNSARRVARELVDQGSSK